tara:strand:- start:23 stop:460 length:438 start_codon:yes stop_codon:yes gene_type:complete
MYNRLGIYGFILLISGKCIYDKHKHIEILEEKIIDLNIELLKCKHELKTLEETNRFRESYLQLEKCMKRIENKENRDLKLVKSDKNKKNITDSDSFEILNQLDDNSDKSVDKSSSEDSSKSKIEPEFESEDDCKFNPLTNPSNDP